MLRVANPILCLQDTDAIRLMKEVGMEPPADPKMSFSVMGKPFDPSQPEAYVDSFAIKRS